MSACGTGDRERYPARPGSVRWSRDRDCSPSVLPSLTGRPLCAEGGPKWGQREAGQIFHLVELLKVEPVLVTLLLWDVNALTLFGLLQPHPSLPPLSPALPNFYCQSAPLRNAAKLSRNRKHNSHSAWALSVCELITSRHIKLSYQREESKSFLAKFVNLRLQKLRGLG